MKVYEVVSITPDQLKYKQLKSPVNKKWASMRKVSPKRPFVGSGAYADVYAPEKTPGEVEKIAKPSELHSLVTDGYYQYLDAIAHSEQKHNPYFPKIYSLKTFRGSDRRYTYQANIERLQPIMSLTLEEIEAIGEHLFNNWEETYAKEKRIYDIVKADDERKHSAAMSSLLRILEACIESKKVEKYIKDPNLFEAILLIKHVIHKSGSLFDVDIHKDNVMIRRGPFMPQLVLTDPLV